MRTETSNRRLNIVLLMALAVVLYLNYFYQENEIKSEIYKSKSMRLAATDGTGSISAR